MNIDTKTCHTLIQFTQPGASGPVLAHADQQQQQQHRLQSHRDLSTGGGVPISAGMNDGSSPGPIRGYGPAAPGGWPGTGGNLTPIGVGGGGMAWLGGASGDGGVGGGMGGGGGHGGGGGGAGGVGWVGTGGVTGPGGVSAVSWDDDYRALRARLEVPSLGFGSLRTLGQGGENGGLLFAQMIQ